MVVVDRFSKSVVFVPAPGLAEEAAKLFHNHVVKYFSLSEDIVNDCNTHFTYWFWTVLFNLMGSELRFFMASHPQTDG